MGYNVATKRKGIFVEKLKSYVKNNPIKIFIVFLTFLVVVHYLFFLFGFSFNEGINENFYMDNNITLEEKGVWGDFSSGHFSILAFLWLAYGIYIQSQEFKLQREEFQNQTEQFKEQNKLYEQQMKELEIQSIQNQFDRKIARLTEIEKEIAQTLVKDIHSKNGLYIFFRDCKTSYQIHSNLIKLEMVFTYLKLYENLFLFSKKSQLKIDLLEELEILKKDIYTNMRISFLLLLFYFQRSKKPTPFTSLKIYHILSSLEIQEWENVVIEIEKLSNTINIFEEIEPSSL